MSDVLDQVEVIDDIDHHMDEAGSIDRAAGPLGVYLAWCANLGMLSPTFSAAHANDLVRLRMRDMRPGEFLIRVAAGTLRADYLDETGLAFTRRYFPQFISDYAAAVQVAMSEVYSVGDSWDNYDRIAPELTRRLYEPGRGRSAGLGQPVRTLARWWRDIRGRNNG